MPNTAATPSLVIRLGNLYVYHVLSFIYKTPVYDRDQQRCEADEKVMCRLEYECAIHEDVAMRHRKKVIEQLLERRMDYLYDTMGSVLKLMVELEFTLVKMWFDEWPFAEAIAEDD